MKILIEKIFKYFLDQNQQDLSIMLNDLHDKNKKDEMRRNKEKTKTMQNKVTKEFVRKITFGVPKLWQILQLPDKNPLIPVCLKRKIMNKIILSARSSLNITRRNK